MAKDPLWAELENMIKGIEQAAYQRGWADAIKHVMSAAQAAQPASAKSQSALGPQHALRPVRRRKVGYGAIGTVIESCLSALDYRGISAADVVEHGREVFNEELLESSVRGRLNRMGRRGELRSERGRWFRVRQPEGIAEQEAGDGDVSPTDHLDLRRHNAAA
jgi:hypothetical protein